MHKAQAAIFDMDGVLVDTLPLHHRCWQMLAQQIGAPFSTERFMKGNGLPTVPFIIQAFEWTDSKEEAERLALEKEKIFFQVIEKEPIVPVAGVKAFLDTLRLMGIPCAVGTSAPRPNLEAVLKNAGLRSYFQVEVTAEEIKKGKPSPDVFLEGAKLLKVAPEKCIVFEDAILGIVAGKAAGMQVIAITTTHSADELTGANRIIDSFGELIPSELFGKEERERERERGIGKKRRED